MAFTILSEPICLLLTLHLINLLKFVFLTSKDLILKFFFKINLKILKAVGTTLEKNAIL